MSETGHAKNVANFETLILALIALDTEYNPSQPLITIVSLQALLADAKAALNDSSEKSTVKTLAVDAREAEYKGLGKFANNIGRAAAVHINDAAFNEDMRSLTRLVNGKRAAAAPVDDVTTPDIDESQPKYSVSHLSYDNQSANFGKIVTMLDAKGGYAPNETEYKLPALETKLAALQSTNNAAKAAYIADDNARQTRDKLLYTGDTAMLARVALVKTYIEYRFGKQSTVYKQIAALKFKQVK